MAKRILVGRAKSSHLLEHTLLPKSIALPVFSSDALSSNAYATEEILLVLLAASAASKHLVMPIALAIAVLLAIVVSSYRQTVRAYPSGGGAYIVSKENLGTIPGLVAASALLIDYVLTVAVSITAGVLAITSAFPSLAGQKVPLALGLLLLLTLANLRGVKEAGTLFAVPTYAFVVSIFAMVGVGLARCATGCPAAEALPPEHMLATTAGSVSLFVILHAFSSGSTALTGVEAISNGVPAFRRPQARNAATTLGSMGAMAIAMFLGISWLATHISGITVSSERSVVAQIAHAVFGGGLGFYVVQAFTAAILVLAANTAYQDFPRLSSILARDRFMPSQFRNRGDRLVFSNGIIVLAAAAGALIVLFRADLSRLIQLYVVGVFTSFTLSQTGMVRHWLTDRDAPQRTHAIAINAIGAVTTGIVLIVITATKFMHGAWIVVAAIPVIVLALRGIERHYEHVAGALRRGLVRPDPGLANVFVFLIRDLGPATRDALAYLHGIRAQQVVPLFVGEQGGFDACATSWATIAPRLEPLRALPRTGHTLARDLKAYLRTVPRRGDGFVTVVLSELVRSGSLWRLLTTLRFTTSLKASLLFTPDVVVTDVPCVAQERPTRDVEDGRVAEPNRHVVLIPVAGVHDGVVRAVNYAHTLQAAHVEALYFATDPEDQPGIVEDWWHSGIQVPLSLVEAPFRDFGVPLLEEVRRYTSSPGSVVTVVIPEFVVTRWWEQPLHGQTALFIKRLLLIEPQVTVTNVPYHVPFDTCRELAKARRPE